MFCWLLEFENYILFCHTISNTYILPTGKTPCQKHRNTPAKNTVTPDQYVLTPLQSMLEAGLHSRQSFLVGLTTQFDAFFNPKTASETGAPNKEQMFEVDTNNCTINSQQELLCCCFYDHVSSNKSNLWLLLCCLRVPFQLASPPLIHVTHIPKGNLVYMFVYSSHFYPIRGICYIIPTRIIFIR